jgi:hypothetical protein
MKGTRQRTKQPAARKPRAQSGTRRTGTKREKGIVLDERAQEQPADRETAQRSGRPGK